jgi:hypothetical protein
MVFYAFSPERLWKAGVMKFLGATEMMPQRVPIISQIFLKATLLPLAHSERLFDLSVPLSCKLRTFSKAQKKDPAGLQSLIGRVCKV